MPSRRPASPGLVVVLTAVGALAAGAAGTAAYLGVSDLLSRDTGRPTGQNPGGSASATQSPAVAVTSVPCPQPTIDAVRAEGKPGDLTQVIYVQGATTEGRRAEAWICLDSDGALYYQGHELSGPFDRARSNSTLLLGAGIEGSVTLEGDTYVGTFGSTRYRVSWTEFAIVNGDERTEFSTGFTAT